jgi:hypothetical protein
MFWWVFVTSGSIWAVGGAGILAGVILYPDSNLLGGLGLVFGPISRIGGAVFQVTLVVWLLHRFSKWVVERKRPIAKDT